MQAKHSIKANNWSSSRKTLSCKRTHRSDIAIQFRSYSRGGRRSPASEVWSCRQFYTYSLGLVTGSLGLVTGIPEAALWAFFTRDSCVMRRFRLSEISMKLECLFLIVSMEARRRHEPVCRRNSRRARELKKGWVSLAGQETRKHHVTKTSAFGALAISLS